MQTNSAAQSKVDSLRDSLIARQAVVRPQDEPDGLYVEAHVQVCTYGLYMYIHMHDVCFMTSHLVQR